MSVNLRYPNITAGTEREQLSQIKSFLHQLVDQLNYALPSMDGASQSIEVQGSEISYYELRSLIMQNLDKIEAEFEKLSQKMTSEYVPKSGWGADKDIVTDASGNVVTAEHSGGNGVSPTVIVEEIAGGHRITITDINGTYTIDVMDGEDGKDGYTPVKGVDYFDGKDGTMTFEELTDEQKASLKGDPGEKGDKGDPGSDANVTAESIEAALGYCPADDEAVSDLYDQLANTNDLVNDFNGDIGVLYTRTDTLAPIVSTTDITAGSAAPNGRPYHVIE